MIRQSLPGIRSLGYVEAEKLQRQIMLKLLSGVPVGMFTDMTPINFVGIPVCETTSDYDNNGRLEKTTLKFVTNDVIPIYKHLAFVMTDCNGVSWLLGQHEKPYPIVRVVHESGEPQGDSNASTFDVTLYGRKTLIECSKA